MAIHSKAVLVVGGGAAGMMAALGAAGHGARVTVLERMEKVGKKILLTGNGRCNISNTQLNLSRYHGAPAGFTERVLRSFSPAQTMGFFKTLGLFCVEEEEGRVYPSCGQASAVLSVLRFEMERRGVQVHGGAEVSQLIPKERGFTVATKDGRAFKADRVIVATGGLASPQLGSNGSGFSLLEGLGHRVSPLFPSLVQLNLLAPFLKEWDGVRFHGAVAVVSGGNVLRVERGEIQLTDDGASGIPVLDLSRTVGDCLLNRRAVSLDVRLLPDRTPDDLWDDVQTRLSSRPDETLERAFVGLVHTKLIPILLREAGYKNQHVPCRLSSNENARRFVGLLNSWLLPITGTQPFERAQVTAGGVDPSELDPSTLESKRVPHLFLAGEILDVDGDCGGYNLQWAWSSGFVAGTHAAL